MGRELTRNLENMAKLIDSNLRNSPQLALRMIEPTIQMLDKAILKSDMFLFTDMKTEKTLMKASSDLAYARSLLEAGNRQEALQLVNQVKDTVSNLKWQPSADRVQRFVVEGQKQLELLRQPIGQQMSQAGGQYSLSVNQETSGRQIYDLLRSLGLSHESEAAQRLVNSLALQGQSANTTSSQSSHAANQATAQPITNIQEQLTAQERQILQAAVSKIANEWQTAFERRQQASPQSPNVQQTGAQTAFAQSGSVSSFVSQLLEIVRQGGNVQPLLQQAGQTMTEAKATQSSEVTQKFEQLQRLFERSTWDQFQSNNRAQEEQLAGQRQNLKALLMELMKEANGLRGGLQQTAEQTLNQLTGQQLLSRFDSQSNMQSMLLSLPVIFKDQVENIKVFVNGKSKAEKIDWENCSLYFLMDTKKIGETGIQISVTNRNLSVTVKNDTPGIQRMFEPLIERFKTQLDDIGYSVKGMRFAPLTEPVIEKKQAEACSAKKAALQSEKIAAGNVDTAYSQKKGFDFKI